MDLRQILRLLRKWFWIILLGALISAGAGYFVSSRQTPIYQASTRFVILKAAPTSLDYYYYYDDNQELMSTYVQLLTTESLLTEASDQLGYRVQKGQATAQQIGTTQFGTVTVKDENPEHAASIANALVSILIEQNNILQSIRYQTAEQNLQDRINEAEAAIAQVQAQLSSLSYTTVQNQLAEVQAKIDELQSQATDLRTRIDQLSLLPSLTLSQLDDLNDKKASLEQVEPILDKYQQIYTNLVVLGTPVESGDATTVQMQQLETTLYLYQEIYIASVSDMEALRLARAQSTPTVVQVEPAVIPAKPISPKPIQTAALAGAVGLLLIGGIIFLIEFLDDTLKTPDEIKDVLDMPVIGLIGELKRNSKGAKNEKFGAYVAKQPRSPVSEAFRSLRTNLEFSSIDHPLRIILITSAGESEGKTTIATNLAIVMAQGGKRVLLLDADMRRPNIHAQFNISNRVGLSDLIRGKSTIDDIARPFEQVNSMHVITSGSLPPNPAELLGSERMKHFLTEVKTRYDIIVIDSPPMLVSDAQILSTQADGLIYVVIPGRTHALKAVRPLEELRRINARLLGVVMNRIPRNRDYYYGGYNYYSPYTNHSGYHHTSTSETDFISSADKAVKPASQN